MISSGMFAPAIFSRERESEIVREFLGAEPGFFVDVGANDPKDGSQTWHLEQRGWTGVLVEPQPALAQRLRHERTAKVHAVACSSPANAGATMTLYLAGIQSSLNPDHFVFKMRRNGSVEVPVRTLDEVLSDANAPIPIDFVSIDVEAHEIEVLDGFDLDRWKPKLILIEDMVFDRRLHRYLESRSYKWVRRTAINSWYVPASVSMPVSLFGRLQFFRKYFLGVPFRRFREAHRRIRHKQFGIGITRPQPN
jgi:FkbM family methyltransferase